VASAFKFFFVCGFKIDRSLTEATWTGSFRTSWDSIKVTVVWSPAAAPTANGVPTKVIEAILPVIHAI
jgi:hypothetical protein